MLAPCSAYAKISLVSIQIHVVSGSAGLLVPSCAFTSASRNCLAVACAPERTHKCDRDKPYTLNSYPKCEAAIQFGAFRGRPRHVWNTAVGVRVV